MYPSQSLRTSGETVIIDGLCASACTIVLGAVPHDKICVTSRANFGFHAAWDFAANGREVTNPDATQGAYQLLPDMAAEFVRRNVGVIAAGAPPAGPARATPWRNASTIWLVSAGQRADEHVPLLLSRRTGFLTALRLRTKAQGS
jgi:hypothetical protein